MQASLIEIVHINCQSFTFVKVHNKNYS